MTRRTGFVALLLALTVVSSLAYSLRAAFLTIRAKPGWDAGKARYTLPNGWRLTPAGQTIPLPGDMPASILFVDNGHKALVNNCGYHDQALSLIDLDSENVVQSVPFKRSWIGLATTQDGDALVSGGSVGAGGANEAIHRVGVSGEGLAPKSGMALPGIDSNEQFVSNVLAGPEGIYVLNIQSDELILLNADGSEKTRAKVGYRPYGLALAPGGGTLAVSDWGDKNVEFLDPSTLREKGRVDVQSHPTAMVYAPDGRLFVANAGANSVSVIRDSHVIETIRTGIDKTDRIGSTPVALAISPDAHTLYVANAGNNCVTVVNVAAAGQSKVLGFIPTARYPSAVAVTPDGKKLLVGTAKGFYGANAGANVDLGAAKVKGTGRGAPYRYIGDQLAGSLAVLDVPNADELKHYTQQVLENAPLGVAAAPSGSERRAIQQGAFSKIKHVIYIIKENRTFDQVLGDIGKGNCDPSLTLFGRAVTPNVHKIADDFILLDNLYTDGEVSQCGHQWTDAAYANDYNEKQWVLEYSKRGEVHSDTRLTSSPGDYIWTLARKHGLSARVYGEYVSMQEDHGSAQDPELKKDPEKFGFSASFEKIFARHGRDTEKVDDFLREMHEAEQTGKWPALMVMALPEDHTNGLSPGRLTPYAMVANNDQAVGKLVGEVSHSKFWKETAIFIIEDDAQDGPDHVDSHRTEGLVVSPYLRRGIVDSTMYSTSSMLRTMELMLGLPPMTQYDANATPMYAGFTTKPDFTPYSAQAPQTDLSATNPESGQLERRSAKLDFSDVDKADFNELNHILWEAYKPGVPYPSPVRGMVGP